MADESKEIMQRVGLAGLILFVLLRPLTLIMTGVNIGSLSAFEIFAIGISYLLLILLLANIKKLQIDRINFLSLMFCAYCGGSLLWGSYVEWTARVILPFLIFFSVRTFVNDRYDVEMVLIALCIGYLIPISVSVYTVAFGQSIERVDYLSKVIRYRGAFKGTHVLGYSMLFFSFLYCLMKRMTIVRKQTLIGISVFLILSVFCLYKSYTRTALVGFTIFWLIYLWSDPKKIRFWICIVSAFTAIITSQTLEKVFWKTETHDLNTASSGRIELWRYNLEVFFNSDLSEQLLGHGIGNVKGLTANDTIVGSSHNDYIELVMAVGIVGLVLYLLIICSLLLDIFQCCIDKRLKFLFGAIVTSITMMNFLSNAVVFRTENAQLFWLFMGLFYCTKKVHSSQTLVRSKNMIEPV